MLNVTHCSAIYIYDQKRMINRWQEQNHEMILIIHGSFFPFILFDIASVRTQIYYVCDQRLHWTTTFFWHTKSHTQTHTACVIIVRTAHNADYVTEIFLSLSLSFFLWLSVFCLNVRRCVLNVLQSNILEPANDCRVVTGVFDFYVWALYYNLLQTRHVQRSRTLFRFFLCVFSFCFVSFYFVHFKIVIRFLFCFTNSGIKWCFFFYFLFRCNNMHCFVFVCCPMTKCL